MQSSLIIVDDFLDNIDAFHNIAIKQDYPPHTVETYFPGANSVARIPIQGLEMMVSRIVGEHLKPAEGTSHAKCRLALGGDEGKGNVHIDRAHWSAMLYLTKPEFCQGGTDFFRHIATNTDHFPRNEAEVKAMGYKDSSEVWDKVVNPDTNDPTKWEKIMTVPMRYNRLILFRPWLWHNAGPSFGDSAQNGRLIYTMFFESKSQ